MIPMQICFLSMDNLEPHGLNDNLAAEVLRSRGYLVDFVPWKRDTDWSRYGTVVIRTPWDYQDDYGNFRMVLRAINASGARLLNPLPVLEWNLHKMYLLELEQRGVPIIPTVHSSHLQAGDLPRLAARLGSQQLVVKPVVGAGARGAFRLSSPEGGADLAAAIEAYEKSEYLAQPFLPAIQTLGEISLMYFRNDFSHAVIKRPKPGDFRVQQRHGGAYEPLIPTPELIAVGARILTTIPRDLLYARIDLTHRLDGSWGVMEVELVEPSLFLDLCPSAPTRFADAFESILRTP